MGITYNPLTGQFDVTGDAGATSIVGGSTPIVGLADNTILYNNGNVVGGAGPLNDGQLLIGTTGSDPAAANITGSSSVSITNGAGSISITIPVSGITNTELASNINAAKIADGSVSSIEFQYLSNVTSDIQTQLNAKIPLTEKGTANGVATLDGAGKVPITQLPSSVMTYEGVWNASTNSPVLTDGTGDAGMLYRVGTAGTQNLGSGPIIFDVGDYVIYNGTIWEKSDTTDAVASVNGLTGVVVLTTTDINEGTNLYYTDERAQDAIGNSLVDSSKIDFTYNDAGNTITATIVAASLTDSDISPTAAIDATKIANGSVDNTEFQYLNGLTSAIQSQLNGKQDLDSTLTALAAYNNNGLLTQTAADTFTGRSVLGGSAISVTNGNGVSGNPTIALDINSLTTNTLAANNDFLPVFDPSGVVNYKINKGNFLSGYALRSTGDLNETSFSPANNQSTPANVGSFSFSTATVRSFDALVHVFIDATVDLYETFKINGIQKSGSWDISISSTGDDSQVVFSIASNGQIQYTTPNYTGFVSGQIKFRAITLGV